MVRSTGRGLSGSFTWKEDATAEQVGQGTWQAVATTELPTKQEEGALSTWKLLKEFPIIWTPHETLRKHSTQG